MVGEGVGVGKGWEGTVQGAGGKGRINVQVVEGRADSQLWAKTYDREAKDIFAVESEVSQEVAGALQAKLSPAEATSLTTAPTREPEAYDLFLKGEYAERDSESTLKAEAFDHAATLYRAALERDPQFGLAAARLAVSRILRHWFVTKSNETELGEIKQDAEHALALAPDLRDVEVTGAEARLAVGEVELPLAAERLVDTERAHLGPARKALVAPTAQGLGVVVAELVYPGDARAGGDHSGGTAPGRCVRSVGARGG